MVSRKFLYGADYYPEHWDRKLWKRDALLMKRAGFNVVRLAEFAWIFMEPQEGVFAFEWLDDALELLANQGIRAILGTPTATIPAWMAQRYPEVMMADRNGHRSPFGIRKDYCYSSPDFNRLSLRIVERMAEHFGQDERVLGWQTDNEFGSSRCRCGLCLGSFQDFLRQRYGSLERLNDAWGTWFWGVRYTSFDQLDWPPEWPNPSHALDAKRFASQLDVDYQARQIATLRRLSPARPVTHNYMGLFNALEYYELGRELDFISWDNYPGTDTDKDFFKPALAHAVTWSIKQANFMVMEQQSGATGWDTYNPPAAPGQMAMLSWQGIARGADGISFFRWRTSISGVEQYWHGILNHDNVPRRRYREVAKLGGQLAKLGQQIIGTAPAAEVGIYNNYQQIWATQIQKQNRHQPILFEQVMQDMAAALAPLAAEFGAFGDNAELSGYKLLLCPPLYLTDVAFVARLERYVRAGGNLVLSASSGVKTIDNVNLMQPLPGPLAKLAGVEVDEYAAIPKDAGFAVELTAPAVAGGGSIAAERIREHLLPAKGTQVVGVHRGTYMDDRPAITRHACGKGNVWYVGTLPTPAGWAALLRLILPQAGCSFRTDVPEGVEIARRAGKGRELTFVINHSSKPKTLNIAKPATDLLSGKKVAGQLHLAGYQVAVLAGPRDRRTAKP